MILKRLLLVALTVGVGTSAASAVAMSLTDGPGRAETHFCAVRLTTVMVGNMKLERAGEKGMFSDAEFKSFSQAAGHASRWQAYYDMMNLDRLDPFTASQMAEMDRRTKEYQDSDGKAATNALLLGKFAEEAFLKEAGTCWAKFTPFSSANPKGGYKYKYNPWTGGYKEDGWDYKGMIE